MNDKLKSTSRQTIYFWHKKRLKNICIIILCSLGHTRKQLESSQFVTDVSYSTGKKPNNYAQLRKSVNTCTITQLWFIVSWIQNKQYYHSQ